MNSMIGRRPDHRRADADAGEPELGDRRVDDAHLAEFLEQTFRDLICALVDGDFLAHEEDAVVALHLFAQRLVEGVSVRDDWHGRACGVGPSSIGGDSASAVRVARRVDETSSNSASSGGSGLWSAKSQASCTTALISSSSLWSVVVGQLAVLLHVHAQQHDRVALHVLLELGLACGTCRSTASDIEWPMKR